MMKRIVFYLLSAISMFFGSVIAKAEPIDLADMRFVTDSSIKEQLMKQVEQSKQRFGSLLYYLAESDRPNIEEVTIADKIAMTVDEAMHEVYFTTFLMNQGKVIGQAVIIYRFDKEKETVNSLYIHALLGDLLDHLKFCEIQHSLNQSEKSSIEEFVSSGQDSDISITAKEIYEILRLPTIKNDPLNSGMKSSVIKLPIKCDVITEADYKTKDVECEEEEEG